MPPKKATVIAAVSAALVTLLVSVFPELRFGYRSPGLHVAFETAAGLVALFSAILVFGRFRADAHLDTLLLTAALGALAATNLSFTAFSTGIAASPPRFAPWSSVAGTALGAALLAGSALLPGRRLHRPKRAAWLAIGGSLAALPLASLIFALAESHLPVAVPPAFSPTAPFRPLLVGSPAVLAVQGECTVLLAAAAVSFAYTADRTRDELFAWLAAATTLGAFARLNYLLFPSLYSEWVFTGDFFRLGFYVLLLVGAAREIRAYWTRLADVAVLDERRRIARDLHDGVAQELAFIAAEASGSLANAAARALDESRRAIAALTRPLDEPLSVALTQAAEEVAQRVGTGLVLSVARDVPASPNDREALIRIVREAITNAARHGAATRVRVDLEENGARFLRITDNGCGFDPGEVGAGGFGLVSMRERAEAIGAEFRVQSEPGHGAIVEVRL